MKRLGLITIVLIATFITTRPAYAATIQAASCNASDVQAALNSVSADNTTVVIPAGTCTWTSPVTYNQVYSTTLQGQSTTAGTCGPGGSCTATDGTIIAMTPGEFNVTTQSNKPFRLTGFTFTLSGAPAYGAMNIRGASTAVRIDHNHITDNASGDHTFHTDDVNGVIDHNLFDGAGNSFNLQIVDAGASGKGDESWNTPDNFGTSQFMFMENNFFNLNGGWAFDCGSGGRLVFRNNVTGTGNHAIQTHGTGSGDTNMRGCRTLEIYGNAFAFSTNPGTNSFAFTVMLENGTGLAFNNTISAFCTFLAPDYMRDNSNTYSQQATPGGLGYCSSSPIGNVPGPSNWDGNLPGQNGYPCMDQPGRGRGDMLSGNLPNKINQRTGTIAWPQQDLVPWYSWGNTLNNTQGYCPTHMWGTDSVTTANRDYFDSTGANCTPGGSCTTGVGSGTTLPTSCTTNATSDPAGNHPGVGFWKTDTNTLYRCTAANTWTAYYTPYTYPHPLTQSATILYGDVSENGSVTAYDASLAAQYAVGSITLTSTQITKADVSGNGSTTSYDASLIAQYAVGLITKFPVQGG